MSEYVRYKGKLKNLGNVEVFIFEDWADNYIKSNMTEELYLDLCNDYSTKLDFLLDYFYDKFCLINSDLYEIIEKKQFDVESDIFEAKINDRIVDFHVMYYNGGCCFTEALEEAIGNIDKGEE